jgi:hypothetical protein
MAVLYKKHSFIGRKVHIEFGERSGVAQVPSHVKEVHFIP